MCLSLCAAWPRRLLLFLNLAALSAATALGAQARPNVLFILADDLGWSDLSCYGAPFNETPRLDRLASEGVRFTQAYSAGSICSPTRASIMTGKYPVRTGVTDYIPGLSSAGRKLTTRPTRTELALEERTLGEAFRDGGYETIYVGKWHLGGKGFEPPEHGFSRYVSSAQLGDYGRDWKVGQRAAEAAVDLIRQRDASRPFFAFVSFHEPHTPIVEYPARIAHFREKASRLPALETPTTLEREGKVRVRQDDPAYASEVAALDTFVGTILDALDAQGLRENSIVIFASDNGGLAVRPSPGPTSNAPLRAGKGWLYEGGVRIPLLVRAPGITRAGATVDAPVLSTDFLPTLLALAGLPAATDIDGMSFATALRGQPAARGALFWHYPHYHGSTWAPGAALRDGDWKLIEQLEYGTVELFNLRDDPGERRDLSRAQPERTAQLLAKLHAWQKSVGAYIPTRNENPGPAPKSKKAKRAGKEP